MKDYRPEKRSKIVATLGPASDNQETLREMILAGLDVVRLNFSHSTTDYLKPLIALIRKLSDDLQVPIAILGDLRGPRIRVGKIEGDSVQLKTGQKLLLTPQSVVGNAQCISVSYAGLAQDVEIGSRLLLDDGNIELEVEQIESSGDLVGCITKGGELASHRGINLPGLPINLPSITKKDLADVDFAIEQAFDFLALSFVQSADDVRQLNTYLAKKGAPIPVIAKIERRSALDDIQAIVQEAYGVMVARGDLALEMSIQDVPVAQKRIIAACRQTATPVITATQMLESMINLSKPTRAEATDVGNAILDGTDALMLSAETAIGKYPVESVAMMSSIAHSTEKAWRAGDLPHPPELTPPKEIGPTVAYASHVVARSLSASVIVPYTASGATARRVACHRSFIPILALSAYPETCRRLALTWGVEAALTEQIRDTDHMVRVALEQVQAHNIAQAGDTVVITAGMPPYGLSGRTNTLKVEQIPKEEAASS